MDTELIATLFGILILLILSGLFSGSETALTAFSRPRMHLLEREGSDRARLVNSLVKNKEKMIGAILLGNNLVNISIWEKRCRLCDDSHDLPGPYIWRDHTKNLCVLSL